MPLNIWTFIVAKHRHVRQRKIFLFLSLGFFFVPWKILLLNWGYFYGFPFDSPKARAMALFIHRESKRPHARIKIELLPFSEVKRAEQSNKCRASLARVIAIGKCQRRQMLRLFSFHFIFFLFTFLLTFVSCFVFAQVACVCMLASSIQRGGFILRHICDFSSVVSPFFAVAERSSINYYSHTRPTHIHPPTSSRYALTFHIM